MWAGIFLIDLWHAIFLDFTFYPFCLYYTLAAFFYFAWFAHFLPCILTFLLDISFLFIVGFIKTVVNKLFLL